MTINRPLRVFLCHSSNDKPAVRELYQKLRAEAWIQPWLDEEELYPGQDWDMEIEKAVEASDAVLVCLTNNSINKRGYVQKELRFVLDIALEIPEETIFIVPLRLEECIPPRSLRDWQYADYFPIEQHERAFQRLLVSLKKRADSLGLKVEISVPKEVEKVPIEEAKARTEEPVKKMRAPAEQIVEERERGLSAIEEKKPAIETPKPAQVVTPPNKITLSNAMEFMRVPAGEFFMGSKYTFTMQGLNTRFIFPMITGWRASLLRMDHMMPTSKPKASSIQ